MQMACSGVLAFAPTTPSPSFKVSKTSPTSVSCSSSHHQLEQEPEQEVEPVAFSYSRALPSVRWPQLKLPHASDPSPQPHNSHQFSPQGTHLDFLHDDDAKASLEPLDNQIDGGNDGFAYDILDEEQELEGHRSNKTRVKKLNKLALKRANDWRERVQFLTHRVLALQPHQCVADVLDDPQVQMSPSDFCFVVKWVGNQSWHRALEVYEWLNSHHRYSPNARMLATILAVLGKANQVALAVEIFTRVEPSIDPTVQVYNAIMGVHARAGDFNNVQQLFNLMHERGCQPDLVSFNTLINARLKSGTMTPNLAIELLDEVRKSGLRPDTITYNTLISACSRALNLDEAMKVFDDMVAHGCQPDLWTYNAMISVYGRCGLPGKAQHLFQELASKGFCPDAVTCNSLVYAFAREGNVEKVKEVCEEMIKLGFDKDEMTYNTIIHMYGKKGQHDLALQLYRDMKSLGRNPDAVTYTVLIDSLGKVNNTVEAASVMSEMLDAGVKPTLKTYSALICAYAKAGKLVEAEETFDCMIRSGIRPDQLAYCVMLDIYLRNNEPSKAYMLYQEMVREGAIPDPMLYEVMLRTLRKENKMVDIGSIINDMVEVGGMSPQTISSILVKGEFFDDATRMLQLAIKNSEKIDSNNFLSILSSYSSSARHFDALELLEFLKEHGHGSNQLITEALVLILCKAKQVDAALVEYRNTEFGYIGSCAMYESLIQCCEETELPYEASQVFSDMRFHGVKPSEPLYERMVLLYCKMGFPETAHYVVELAEAEGMLLNDFSIYVEVIEAYGLLKLWQKAETMVGNLRQNCAAVDRKVWNALMQAYAASGQYERARAVFNTMMRDGPSPTVDSMNSLLKALIVDGRLDELYVVIQELQDMGFKISKSSILLMLDAFAQSGNIFEVKKIYSGMKAAGYFPTMHLYRVMIGLLCRGKRVRDVESMLYEMEEAGFKPDISIWNSILRLYVGIDDFRKTTQVYQQIKENQLEPDEDTYNTLIIMYCRDCRPEEGLSLMYEMRRQGLDPKLDTYKSLISAFGKHLLIEQAEELFGELQSKGCKLDRSFYHIMMKLYRNSGNHSKAEKLLSMMGDAGVEPSLATMHLLMVSYGSSGQPQEAEKVLFNLKEMGLNLGTLPYSSVMDAYLRNGDYSVGIEKLSEMKTEGLVPDHRIWTIFIRAASLCQHTSEAIVLLNAIQDSGCDLPIRLLTENSESLVLEMDHYLEMLEPVEDDAAFNFVNALTDLLWAFELRATASWVFQLAVKRRIYHHDVFRVADKDWGADFRKLSGGAALVGLTLWLDHMQDASLQGQPESPKSVVLITGTAEYNRVSLNSTLKACLWEMGSPFRPCRARSGLLIAKAHSLQMWLKESPFCLDLELKNAASLPTSNSMQLIEGCLMRCDLVPAFKEINEKLGFVRPKKFAKLALLSDEKREEAIHAYIEGGREKEEKLRRKDELGKKKKMKKRRKGKYIRQAMLSKPAEDTSSGYLTVK